MKKWMMVAVAGLSIVTGTLGWLTGVEHFGSRSANTPKLMAQGGAPVPPTPWDQGGAPVPPTPWKQ